MMSFKTKEDEQQKIDHMLVKEAQLYREGLLSWAKLK